MLKNYRYRCQNISRYLNETWSTPIKTLDDDIEVNHDLSKAKNDTSSKKSAPNVQMNSNEATVSTASKKDVGMKRKRPVKSDVWNFFIKNEKDGTCKLCLKLISAPGCTTNLTNHLKGVHGNVYKPSTPSVIDNAVRPVIMKVQSTEKKLTQLRIDTIKDEINSCKSGPKSEKISNALIYMIVKDDLPLSATDKPGLQKLLQIECLYYEIPGRNKITTLIEHKAEALKLLFQEKLSKIECFSLIADVWTDTHNSRSFLGCTAHYHFEGKLSEAVLVNILRPAEIVTKNLSGEKYVTISDDIFCYYFIINEVKKVECRSETIKTARSYLIERMRLRFKGLESHSLIFVAGILDPRYKNSIFPNDDAAYQARKKVIDLIQKRTPIHQESTPTNSLKPTEKKKSSFYGSQELKNYYQQHIAAKSKNRTTSTTNLDELEFKKFLDSPPQENENAIDSINI
ncbi:Protein of unknown function, partial [Cotesia congregata]